MYLQQYKLNHMKKWLVIVGLLLNVSVTAQNSEALIFKNYGQVYNVPNAADVVDTKATYKILIDITTTSGTPATINENIENIARIMNLHAVAGIPAKKIKMVAVFHSAAIVGLLNNESYKEKNKVDNPNLPLLKSLKEAGVELYVCGQTLAKRNIDAKNISTDVLPALSAITTITSYVSKGYTVFKY